MAKSTTNNIIDTVGDWYAKLPNIPKGGREFLVTITPWIALIFGILGILAGVAGLGILTALSPLVMMSSGIQSAGGGIVSAILLLASSVLLLMAFSGTKNHKAKGWMFLFWSEAVSIVAAVISFNIGGVVMSLIGFYIIYQIRSYYK